MSMNAIPVHVKRAVYVSIVKAHTHVNVTRDGRGRTVQTVSHGVVLSLSIHMTHKYYNWDITRPFPSSFLST